MRDRSADKGRSQPPLRPVELFALTGAPEYDDDVKEWKVTGVPVRTIWGGVSGSGDWIGGGSRGNGERRWREEPTEYDSVLWLPDWWRKPNSQEAIEYPPPLWVGERIYTANIDGYLHVTGGYKDREVGFLLKEAHQGRGVETDIYLGIWNIADQEWEYACTPTAVMIHWRYGTPEPIAGATGLGVWRESTTNGAILEVVVGDCDSLPVTCT